MGSIRPRLAATAVLASSLTLLAGCASSTTASGGGQKSASGKPSTASSASASASTAASFTKGALLLSNGTATVTVGGHPVTFPTTVTDAAWSPDGSRIAFVDANGNIDTARPDGTGRVVLTKANTTVTRSDPAWIDNRILFAEKPTGSGVSALEYVSANGYANVQSGAFGTEQEFGYPSSSAQQPTNFTAPSSASQPLADSLLGAVAFQHQASDGAEVWILDENQREPSAAKIANGTEPALSPDGQELAYVAPDGHIAVVSGLINATGKVAAPVALTGPIPGATHLAFSADGSRIAFSTATGVESVSATVPTAGAASNTPQTLSSTPAVPSYLTGGYADTVDGVYSADPIAESIAASQDRYPTEQSFAMSQNPAPAAGAVVAASSDAANALLSDGNGPLLFTTGGSSAALDPRVAAELKRIFGKAIAADGVPTVTIVGGTAQVSAAAEASIRALGYDTQRVADDQYTLDATQLKSASQSGAGNYTENVAVVSGSDPALVAAVEDDAADNVVLTQGATLPAAAASFLSGLGTGSTIYVVGAQAQTAMTALAHLPSGTTVTDLVGADDAQTSALVAEQLDGQDEGAVLTDGTSVQQLAVALSVARAQQYPLLIVNPAQGLEPGVTQFLGNSSGTLDTDVLVGSPSVLGTGLSSQAGNAISGPLGWNPGTLTYTIG